MIAAPDCVYLHTGAAVFCLAGMYNVRVKIAVKEQRLVREKDILMCSRNGSAALVGKVAKIPKLEEKVTFGAFMTVIRSNCSDYLRQEGVHLL